MSVTGSRALRSGWSPFGNLGPGKRPLGAWLDPGDTSPESERRKVVTTGDDAPATTGASQEDSGEPSHEEYIATTFANQEVVGGSVDPDNHGLTPVTEAVPGLPAGVELPKAMMVGERGVVIRPDGFYVTRGKGKDISQISAFYAFVAEHRVRDDGITVVAEFAVDVC